MLVDFFEDSSDCSYQYAWIFFATSIEAIGIVGAFSLVSIIGRGNTQGSFWLTTSLLLIGWLMLSVQGEYWPSISFLFATKVTVSGGAAALWLHSAELYPVTLRATGHSAANIMGKLGSFAAVFWVDAYAGADASNFVLGTAVYLVAAAIAGILAFSLRETKGDEYERVSGEDDDEGVPRGDREDAGSREDGSLLADKAKTRTARWC